MISTTHFVVLLFWGCAVQAISLRDNPIGSAGALQYLDGKWNLKSSTGQSISGNVPGDLITDLYQAKLMPEPLTDTNWIDHKSLWVDEDWTYERTFEYKDGAASEVLLVFEGVKLGATLRLNGQYVGQFADQFVRYEFPVLKYLSKSGNNTISVYFQRGMGPGNVDFRWMSCSAGWDWAPVSKDPAVLTRGIWKSVYLVDVPSEQAVIRHVAPMVKYNGDYPTSILTDSSHGGFTVEVKIHLFSTSSVSQTLSISTDWGASYSQKISVEKGNVTVTASVAAEKVSLWWPTGLGPQNLHQITVTYGSSTVSRKIGFRVFALVTDNDSDPSKLKGLEGSGSFTMIFKVNGAYLYSRGANLVPMEDFEGRADPNAIRNMLQSVAAANMNTIRIWGGGIFMYDVFYDTCDELGIMLYHDMMYNEPFFTGASNTTIQDAEVRHQIRRLSHHPSIVIWDACNECQWDNAYSDVFDRFVMATVALEDQSRTVWPSSPSHGWRTGVDRLYLQPNGHHLLSNQSTTISIEKHGPYFGGNGWPTVQGQPHLGLYGANIPPNLGQRTETGPHVTGSFTSEFGFVAMSSFESMSGTLSSKNWGVHTSPMYQRNYACDNVIIQFFGKSENLNATGESDFKKQLYQCMMGQALTMKSHVEQLRAGNVFGSLIWQLNEIWPTGGWGMIEYGTPSVTGQVSGGRWKPAMHWLANGLFGDVIVACGTSYDCYIKNDGIKAFSGTVVISSIRLSDGATSVVLNQPVNLAAGPGVMQWFCMSSKNNACQSYATILSAAGCKPGGTDCVFSIEVTGSGHTQVFKSTFPIVTPQYMETKSVEFKSSIKANKDNTASITLSSSKVAVYTVLTTQAQGRFSDNAFTLLPSSPVVITFVSFGDLDINKLTSTLRIESANP